MMISNQLPEVKPRAALEESLAEHPFLQGIAPEHLQIIAACATEASFKSGRFILQEKQDADMFYLLLSGSVALGSFIPGRGFTTVQDLAGGEIVGWSWLIPPHKWHFSALVVQDTRVIAIDGRRLRQQCKADHEFGYEMYKRVAMVVGERLRSTRQQLS